MATAVPELLEAVPVRLIMIAPPEPSFLARMPCPPFALTLAAVMVIPPDASVMAKMPAAESGASSAVEVTLPLAVTVPALMDRDPLLLLPSMA